MLIRFLGCYSVCLWAMFQTLLWYILPSLSECVGWWLLCVCVCNSVILKSNLWKGAGMGIGVYPTFQLISLHRSNVKREAQSASETSVTSLTCTQCNNTRRELASVTDYLESLSPVTTRCWSCTYGVLSLTRDMAGCNERKSDVKQQCVSRA
jgi:hypothetical protein